MTEKELLERSLRVSKDFAKEIRAYFYEVSKERALTEKENALYSSAHEVHIRTNDALMLSMVVLNKKEQILVEILENAKKYCKGELELKLEDTGIWVVMDYRKDCDGSFPIESKEINHRIISVKEAENTNVDIRKCCEVCNISYVE